jgi:hypothetical protein
MDRYTQLVWANTNKVGCGITAFSISNNINEYLYVCNYGPGGNYEGGSMYKVGGACTQCPTTAPRCENGLCVEEEPPRLD